MTLTVISTRRQHEAITRRTCLLVNEVGKAKATDSEEHLWSPTLTYIFECKQTVMTSCSCPTRFCSKPLCVIQELAGVIYSSWVQLMRQMQRGAFDFDRVTRAEPEKLQEWKNHLRFLLWALPSAFRPEMNGDTFASLRTCRLALRSNLRVASLSVPFLQRCLH